MSGVPPIGAPAGDAGPKQRGAFAERLLSPKTIIGLLIVALAVWFVLANNSHTRIHLWVVWVTARLWVVLAVTFLAGMLAGYLIRRRGREKQPRE